MLERGLKLSHLYEEIIVINCDFYLYSISNLTGVTIMCINYVRY